MNVRDLIFDWKKPDGRRRDKLYAFLVVSALFATFAAVVELRLPAPPSGTAQSAEVMRFAEEGMARSWLRDAEENGPFPGRLQVEAGKGTALVPFGGQLDAWTDYRASLRPLPTQDGLERIEITPKGRRVFPVIPGPELSAVDNPSHAGRCGVCPSCCLTTAVHCAGFLRKSLISSCLRGARRCLIRCVSRLACAMTEVWPK